MVGSLIKWHLKKWWPLILILSLVCAIPFMTTAMGYDFYTYGGRNHIAYLESAWAFAILIPALLITFVMPVFVYNYRTSIQAADCFYQAGYNKNTISRTRVLIGLGIILASVTAGFLLGIAILAFRYGSSPLSYEGRATYNGAVGTYYKNDINFGYAFLFYLLLILIVAGTYMVNTFFVSLGDSVLVQIFLLISGNILLSLFFFSPYTYVLVNVSINHAIVGADAAQYVFIGAGPYQSGAVVYMLMAPLIAGQPFEPEEGTAGFMLASAIIQAVVWISVSVYLMIKNDPSGEYAGKWKPRNARIAIVPHLAVFTIGMLVSLIAYAEGSLLLSNFMSFGMFSFYAVIYYALLALMRKSFKPSKFDLFSYLSVVGTVLFMMIFISANGGLAGR